MIPSSRSSRPFGRPSPQLVTIDLAREIDRTVKLALEAKHELGFAAVNTGCDGRKRTTLFDGSACQVDGDVCIATRQDGVSACIDTPARGSGLVVESISFEAPVCVPVTGWWLVDSAGYMYRVPQSLIDAAPYWPMTAAPLPTSAILVRAQTWAKLMCGAAIDLTPSPPGVGGVWTRVGESDWFQQHSFYTGGVTGGVISRRTYTSSISDRVATVYLADVPDGIVATYTIAYGYPYGAVAEGFFARHGPASPAPWGRPYTWDPPGTPELDCAGRTGDDMALCYRRGLAVYCGENHVNLDGIDITDCSDFVSLTEMDPASTPPLEARTNVVPLPNGEVALFGSSGDYRDGLRYRLRATPIDAPTVAASRIAPGVSWGDDENAWTAERTYSITATWAPGATAFALNTTMSDYSIHPFRGIPVALFKRDDAETDYLTSSEVYYGTLGPTTAGLTQVIWPEGVTVPAPTGSYTNYRFTIIGRILTLRYGWTFEVAGSLESALSALSTAPDLSTIPELFSVEVTVPGGPTGTVKRHLYRFGYDLGSAVTGGSYHAIGPWSYLGNESSEHGAVYDRMFKRIATFEASELEPGTDPITYLDEDTDITLAGTRPPSPLIYVGPITIDAPREVHVLPPMNL